MSSPRTAAGRALLERMDESWVSLPTGSYLRSGPSLREVVAIEAEAAAAPGLRAALFPKIAAHLQKAARQQGYTHPEHLSGPEWPATDIPCLPETVAEQVVEKYLMEYDER